MNQNLVVFTRYPEPGRTKTRLIPALGTEGAATLQRQMTEHTLATVARWLAQEHQSRGSTVRVLRTGGSGAQFRAWLGADWVYEAQVAGDLGDRMAAALATGVAAGHHRVVIIGIDCPGITSELLNQAFGALQTQDLVLGPALDGGYYLVGLRAEALTLAVPALFTEMAWGTNQVLAETLHRAAQQGLAVMQLPPLQDVDDPEDLPLWEQFCPKQRTIPAKPRISVIIPTKNEAVQLPQILERLRRIAPQAERILCDGGSTDDTVAIAQTHHTPVLIETGGRARQLNRGAALAQGEILLFLHADTQLPEGFEAIAQQTLAQAGVVAGAFELRIEGEGLGLRAVEWGVRWRSRLLQLPYGDQAIFLRKDVFEAIGGFADLPIMEDFELMRRLQRQGRVAIAMQAPGGLAPAAVTTSARRWQTLGVVRTTLLNQGMILGYKLGISGDWLARWYRRQGKR